MDLKHNVFKKIEHLLEQGNVKAAAKYLWNIAKSNRMIKLKKQLSSIYKNAVNLEIYADAKAIDDFLAKSQRSRLSKKLSKALATIQKAKNLTIPTPKYNIWDIPTG